MVSHLHFVQKKKAKKKNIILFIAPLGNFVLCFMGDSEEEEGAAWLRCATLLCNKCIFGIIGLFM